MIPVARNTHKRRPFDTFVNGPIAEELGETVTVAVTVGAEEPVGDWTSTEVEAATQETLEQYSCGESRENILAIADVVVLGAEFGSPVSEMQFPSQ